MPQQRIEFEGAIHEFPDDFTDAEIAAALSGGTDSGSILPGAAAGAAAIVARQAAERVGLQVATSPNLGRVMNAASRPAAQMAARAIGVTGGLPGYIAGEALTSPAVTRAAETGIRGSGSLLARMAGSKVARAATGLPGILASMVTNPGDQPADLSAGSTAARQTDFAHKYKADVNARAGYEVITGKTTPEILESIARYRGAK